MTPVEAEALFAAIGLLPILRARPQLHRHQLQAAAATMKNVRRRMASFLGASEFAEAKELPEFDYDEVLEFVSAGQTIEQTRALFAAVPDHDMATEFGLKADGMARWAKRIIPRAEHDGFLAMHVEPPDDVQLADFRRVWQVACDPLSVLDDLEDGSLADDQVTALVQLYPALYAEMRQAVVDAAAALMARRGQDWQPPAVKAAYIAVLRQEDQFDASLSGDVQAIFAANEAAQEAAAKAQEQGGAPGGAPSDLSNATPGQEATAG